jgi:hypothetical protein
MRATMLERVGIEYDAVYSPLSNEYTSTTRPAPWGEDPVTT